MGHASLATDAEYAWRWRDEALGDVEFLRARYVTHSFAPHTHDGYAFGVIDAGAEAFWYRGATRIAAAGDLVALNPDELHTGSAAAGAGGWTYRMMYPSAEIVERIAVEYGLRRGAPTFPESVIRDPTTASLFQRVHDLVSTEAGALREAGTLLDVIAALLRRHAVESRGTRHAAADHRIARAVQEYIAVNYRHNVTLAELSAAVDVSPFHLARLFRAARGIPPHRYLEQRRVHEARRLIRQGQPLSLVAAAAGFADQAQLTRHFKRHFGVTPGTYRRGLSISPGAAVTGGSLARSFSPPAR